MNEDLEIMQNPALEKLSPEPQGFRYPKENFEALGLLKDLYIQIHQALENSDLPDKVKGHPFYEVILRGFLEIQGREKRAFHINKRNQARFIPHRPNEAAVQGVINEFAGKVVTTLESGGHHFESEERPKAVNAIRKVINHLIGQNLLTVGNAKLFYLGKNKKGEDVLASTVDLKKSVKDIAERVDNGYLDSEKAMIAVLMELGAIQPKEIKRRCRKTSNNTEGGKINLEEWDLEPLNEEILRSLKWAHTHVKEKLEWMNGLINHYLAEGKIQGGFDRPDANQGLRMDDAFELLKKLFDKETNPRDANDIQIILNFALMHWTWERAFKEIRNKRLKEIEKTVLETLCKKDASKTGKFETVIKSGPVLRYIDDLENPRFEEIPNTRENVEVYRVQPRFSKGREISLYSYLMEPKSADSGVGKHLDDDQGTLTPERVSDYYRTRFMLWGINAKTLKENPSIISDITGMLNKVTFDLDLLHVRIKEPKVNDKFIKWQLIGKTKDGIPVEIQFIPHDTYLFDQADNSGIDHEDFSELRDIKRWTVCIPPSISRVIHEAFKLRETELEEKRARTKIAMGKFDYEQLTLPN